MSGILLLPPLSTITARTEILLHFFSPVEKLRIGSLPCADRAYKPVSNNRPVRLSRISTCYADHTFGSMRMDKKWRFWSFLGHKMVVRRLTKEEMSEFNCNNNLLQEHSNWAKSTVAAAPPIADTKQFEVTFYPFIAEGRNLRGMFRLIRIKPSSGLGHKHKHKK